MFIIRPIQEDDLDSLMSLLELSGHGLTSLPKDRDIIRRKILHSERSFMHKIEDRPMGESYLFVLEDLKKGVIVGISGLISKLGGFEPFYVYRVQTEQRRSPELKLKNTITSLHLEKIHSGPAEICALFLSPSYRNSQNGRLLSLSRFLFIANSIKHFEKNIVAEMRGVVDDQGNSPFWEAVGKKFFRIDFPQADYLQVKTKQFIEDLLPTHPLIADLLPDDAQKVVGQVHPETVPARRILEKEGFSYRNKVAILEPGPILEAEITNLRSIKDARTAKVEKILEKVSNSKTYIITNLCSDKNFLASMGALDVDEKQKTISLTTQMAAALQCQVGDKLRYVPIK